MTEFHVEVVRLGKVSPHPNADTLSVTLIHQGYPVTFRTGEFQEGDLAVYLPVDSVAPSTPEWEFLGPGLRNHRIKAKKIRGTFSMGMLTKAPPGLQEGTDVSELLGFVRYEDSLSTQQYTGVAKTDGLEVPAPKLIFQPKAYDIEPYRRYGSTLFAPHEEVVVLEKIHGQNARFVHDGTNLHVGSRVRWLNSDSWVAKSARRYNLEEPLKRFPHIVFFGETYGNNDLGYSVDRSEGDALALFDAWDSNTGQWLDFGVLQAICNTVNLPVVPILALGKFGDLKESLPGLAEGATTIGDKGHVREGWVIKPTVERTLEHMGRVILKMHGEGFLTRKTKG